MRKPNFQDISRRGWTVESEKILDQLPFEEQIKIINAGSLQRIATALEKSAKNFDEMASTIDYYKRTVKTKNQEIEDLKNTNRTLKGHVTRSKQRIKELESGGDVSETVKKVSEELKDALDKTGDK